MPMAPSMTASGRRGSGERCCGPLCCQPRCRRPCAVSSAHRQGNVCMWRYCCAGMLCPQGWHGCWLLSGQPATGLLLRCCAAFVRRSVLPAHAARRHGRGKYSAGAYKYEGEWHDDRQHGSGVCQTDAGDKYVGEFRKRRSRLWSFFRVSVVGKRWLGWQHDMCRGPPPTAFLHDMICFTPHALLAPHHQSAVQASLRKASATARGAACTPTAASTKVSWVRF